MWQVYKFELLRKKKNINLTFVFMFFRYQLLVYVLGRPVSCNGKTGNIEFSIIKSIDHICQYSRGPSMQQPVAIAVDHHSARVRCQKNYVEYDITGNNMQLIKMFVFIISRCMF